MKQVTFQVDDITVTHEFRDTTPVLEIIRHFYDDRDMDRIREKQLRRLENVSDMDKIEGVLQWFVDHVFDRARAEYAEKSRRLAAKEAADLYQSRLNGGEDDGSNGTSR